MARVTVEDCVDKVPNRFELVMLAAHRARALASGSPLTVERDNDKNPVVALREIADETLTAEQLRENGDRELPAPDRGGRARGRRHDPARRQRRAGRGRHVRGAAAARADGSPGRKLSPALAATSEAAQVKPGPDGIVPVETLTALVRSYNPHSDSGLIEAAYDYGLRMHAGQTARQRRALLQPSGRGRDAARRAEARRRLDHHRAAARHDRGHRCSTYSEIALRFGDEIAQLVDGVTKLTNLELSSVGERAGGELPQAPDGDVEGPARPPRQARRPAAQHAHDQAPARPRSSSARRARPWTSSRRSPAGWACSGCATSSRTSPSAC